MSRQKQSDILGHKRLQLQGFAPLASRIHNDAALIRQDVVN